ncbi:MAG: ABC transporter transmembrane domain-containing protein [Legionella sp.]|nr:ABC transporter transmembrane domain-containing protein [Legionella sp.]
MEQTAAQQKTKKNSLRDRLFKLSGIDLLISEWKSTTDVIHSVMLASLTINLLALIFPLILLQVYDRIIPNEAILTLVWLAIGLLISLILGGFLKIARIYVGAWADARFEHMTGCNAFDKILGCQLQYYESEGSGRQLKRITALNTLKQFYAGQVLTSLVNFPFIIIFLVLIAYIGSWLVLIPLVIIALAFYVTQRNTQGLHGLLKTRQDHDSRRLNFIVEAISKIHTIKSNTMEAQMLRRYERLQRSTSFYDFQTTQSGSALTSDSMFFSQLTIAAVVGFGSTLVFNNYISVGALAACTLLAGQCLQPVNGLISLWGRLQNIRLAHDDLNKILHMKSEFSSDQVMLDGIEGQIEFKDVSFNYTKDNDNLFEHLNLIVKPRETISITGEKLSGKSTLLSLILKLLLPSGGTLKIDGHDIMTLSPENLRRFIGYMPKQAILFQGTIMDNLTQFNPQYEGRAKELSEKIGLASFVEHFPDGYDTKIGTQNTDTLPRGIMQRIAIIRAVIRSPSIILFDEANMSLDMEGDKHIKEFLEGLRGEHTMIIVSHRPSILNIAEKHYIIENKMLRLMNEKSDSV